MKWVNKCLVTAIGAVLAVQVMASGGGAKMAEGVNYIPLEPALVVNYGGPGGKPRYVKADLSLRAENAEDATEIMHHLPLICDRLVSILSAQPEEIVSSVDGREYLRVFALAEINKALLLVGMTNTQSQKPCLRKRLMRMIMQNLRLHLKQILLQLFLQLPMSNRLKGLRQICTSIILWFKNSIEVA